MELASDLSHPQLAPVKQVAGTIAAAPAARRTLVCAEVALTHLPRHLETQAALWRDGAGLHVSCADVDRVRELGADGMARVVEGTPLGNQLRLTGAQPRPAAELALAAGFRSLHCGGVGTASHDGPPLPAWLEADELVGRYESHGVAVHRSYAAPAGAPAVAVACLVLDALLGAERGVRRMTLELSPLLDLRRDVAALRVTAGLARRHLERHGFGDCTVTTALRLREDASAGDEADSSARDGFQVLTGSLGGAAVLVLPQGADRLGKSMKLARSALVVTGSQRYPDSDAMSAMEQQLEDAACALVDRALALEPDDKLSAVLQACERGAIEVPGP